MQDSSDGRFAQLMHYISRGWALTPLHDVSAGQCSCRQGPACRSAGKHPRREEWQRPEHLVRDEAGLRAALDRWPSSNWGLATGLVSGVWAVDYDPGAVRADQAAEVARWLAVLNSSAAWVQRTGGGGLHFVFALPPDFVPNNGSGTLPAGFDVRGARRGQEGGGQIVVAPSVTLKGAYEVLADHVPVTGVLQAPPELLDAVRPAPPRVMARPATEIAASADQIGRYITASISGELAELRATWVQRNQRAWKAAARCVELVNTGLVGGEAVYAAWWAAAQAHPDLSVTVPDVELLRVWASAERHVGDRPADLSGVGGPRGWGGDAVLPPHAPPAPALGGGPSPAGGAAGSYQQAVRGVVDNPLHGALQGVASQVSAVATPPAADSVEAVDALMARLLDVDRLRHVAPPQPLVNGVLDLDVTAWLIGEPGSYKSFVTLDLAAHVGLGRPWRGHDVHQGEVVYIVAEGARGMRLRVDAWEREYGPMKGLWFLPEPVQAADAEWTTLVELCRRLRPVLVVVDTQARVTLGLEENSNTDMGRYVAQVDRIRRATGACVLTVHHTARGGKNARGASALDGAQDAELRVERPKDSQLVVELHADKQKDQDQGKPVILRLRRSDGGMDTTTGRDLSSLVIDHNETPILGEPSGSKIDVTRHRALLIYRVLAEAIEHGGEGITRSDARTGFFDLPEIAALPAASRRSAWRRSWNLLVSRGRVMRYGTSQRLGVFPPPDGADDGLLTMNTGRPEDAPPEGWSIHWPEADRLQAVSNSVDNSGE